MPAGGPIVCGPDCECGRHRDQRCLQGCSCLRHENSGNRDPKPFTEEHRLNLSRAGKGRAVSEGAKESMRVAQASRNAEGKPRGLGFTGKRHTEEVKAKIRDANRENWKKPEYARKVLTACGQHPNLIEVKMLEQISSLGFQYVGDGTLLINGKSPDFWDGGNRLVELYGDYWHRGQDPQKRIDFFRRQGYACLVIWENEYRVDPLEVVERIAGFSGQ